MLNILMQMCTTKYMQNLHLSRSRESEQLLVSPESLHNDQLPVELRDLKALFPTM